MGRVVKGYFFNQKANKERNLHVFLFSRANLGSSLRDLETMHPDKKFVIMRYFEGLKGYLELDSESFNKIVSKRLNLIRSKSMLYTAGYNRSVCMVDTLVKHFRL